MAHRQQARRIVRAPRGAAPGTTREDAAVEDGARRQLGAHDARSLESLVHDPRQLREEAERSASGEPSRDALRAYRRAAREPVEAERALVLIGVAG